MAGKAKVLGTLTSISGAMVLTLYKGVEVKLWSTSVNLPHRKEQQSSHQHSDQHNPFLGTILIITSVITSSFSLIIQSKMAVTYPCHYSSSALICTFGALQTIFYALCAERNWSRWKLGWDVRLLTSVYAVS
ncbi:hypothetical protein LIER_38484 [Lithospermum erythrorhizon]|uniref:WAT1-related protein n=1 Tax=Lithospermum erythrorhizon TaxID=34254 RepID=A0AAV3Q574_LITER